MTCVVICLQMLVLAARLNFVEWRQAHQTVKLLTPARETAVDRRTCRGSARTGVGLPRSPARLEEGRMPELWSFHTWRYGFNAASRPRHTAHNYLRFQCSLKSNHITFTNYFTPVSIRIFGTRTVCNINFRAYMYQTLLRNHSNCQIKTRNSIIILFRVVHTLLTVTIIHVGKRANSQFRAVVDFWDKKA